MQAGDAVLMSGASGAVGLAIRASLQARGVRVVQLVRGTPRGDDQIQWNPQAATPVADVQALNGMSAAIHLSGANLSGHRWTSAYKRELFVSRVHSTHALAVLLAGLTRPPRTLVVASAVGIYGNRGEEILDERSAPGEGFLADLCLHWEEAARPAAGAGMRVVHTRFGIVLDKNSGALKKMLPLFRAGLGGRLGSGNQWMSWVSLADLVRATEFMLATDALQGAVNVTAPNPVTNREFTHVLARHLRRPAILPAPALALKLAFGKMADEALLASTRAMPSELLKAGFQFRHSTLDAALEGVLGREQTRAR